MGESENREATDLVHVQTGDVETDDAAFHVSQQTSHAEVFDQVLHDGRRHVLQATGSDVRGETLEHARHSWLAA